MRCKTQAHDPACCALDWAPTQMKTKENDAKQQQIIITKKLFEILFYLGTGALLLAHRAPRFGC